MSKPVEKEPPRIQRSEPIDIIFPRGFKKEKPRRKYRFFSEDDYNPVRLVENLPGTSTNTSYISTERKLATNSADEAHCAIQYFNPLRPAGNFPGTSTQDVPTTSNGDTQSTNPNSTSSQTGTSRLNLNDA